MIHKNDTIYIQHIPTSRMYTNAYTAARIHKTNIRAINQELRDGKQRVWRLIEIQMGYIRRLLDES